MIPLIKPKIKICGLTRTCDIEAVNAAKPEYIGFVFAESRRRVTPEQAADLRRGLSDGIIPVGVFLYEKAAFIAELVKNGTIGMIQLHGNEDDEYIKSLKQLTDAPVIKAVPVQKAGDVQKYDLSSADYLLLDNKTGGTGHAFDWGLIGKSAKPYFLAGGLNIDNVAAAINQTAPFAVDVSSGVETNGLKDFVKINDFVGRVRSGK